MSNQIKKTQKNMVIVKGGEMKPILSSLTPKPFLGDEEADYEKPITRRECYNFMNSVLEDVRTVLENDRSTVKVVDILISTLLDKGIITKEDLEVTEKKSIETATNINSVIDVIFKSAKANKLIPIEDIIILAKEKGINDSDVNRYIITAYNNIKDTKK